MKTNSNELYHYGVKGMKWGQHIFAKKRVNLGRKDKQFEGGSYNASRRGQKKNSKGSSDETKKKTYKEMTDAELKKETERYNLEANYMNARERATPKKSKNENLGKTLMRDMVQPALINAGRQQFEKYLNKELSKIFKTNEPSEIEKLKKEAEKFGYESRISTAKKVIDSNDRYFKEQKAKEDRKAAAQKQVEDYYNKTRQDNSTYSKSGDSITDRKMPTGKPNYNAPRLEQVERYKATWRNVEGEGTGKYSKSNRDPAKDIVYDGQMYVERLLRLEDNEKRR